MPRLSHVPATDGAFTHDGETYEMKDGVIEVDEPAASEIVELYTRVSYAEPDEADVDPTPEPEESDEDEICGVEMTDGSICERPADSCPYHS